jgi:hypothetical protein
VHNSREDCPSKAGSGFFEPEYEEFRPRNDLESFQCLHVCIQRTRSHPSHPTVQGHGQAGRIPRNPVARVWKPSQIRDFTLLEKLLARTPPCLSILAVFGNMGC